jgi:hypothetical protein
VAGGNSDLNGVYNFGWGWPANKTIPAGFHRAIINRQGANPRFGMIEGFVEVVANELNRGPSFVVPSVPASAQFSEIRGGERQVMSGGRLVLGLEDATLDFNATGVGAGAVAPRVTDVASCGYAGPLLIGGLFALRLEPGGIAVRGPVGVDLALPQIGGSFEYLDTLWGMKDNKPPLILFGLDPATNMLAPVDVLEVDTVLRRARTTQRSGLLSRLDVLAVARVTPMATDAATKYLRGEVTFSDVLAAWLSDSTEVVK